MIHPAENKPRTFSRPLQILLIVMVLVAVLDVLVLLGMGQEGDVGSSTLSGVGPVHAADHRGRVTAM